MNDYFTSQILFTEITHWLYDFNMTLQIIIIDEAMCPTARIKSGALKITYEHKALHMEKYQRPTYDNVAIFVMIDAWKHFLNFPDLRDF